MNHAAPQPVDAAAPSVWLLFGQKVGDNNQLLALVEGLGWDYDVQRVVPRRWELVTNRLLGVTLAGIDRRRSTQLTPPWPDLVLTAGRRNEPVARWIRRRSGGRTRLVRLGRPWAPLSCFDLVVSTPQYELPDRPNVLHNDLPLHRLTPRRLAAAARHWEPRLAHLPRPWVALLVGGSVGPYRLTPEKLTPLAREANAMASRCGGSLLVTTSSRTPTGVLAMIERTATVPGHFFAWSPGAADNPYDGYLALADSLVVTGESISMVTECCATEKPVYIFDPGAPKGLERLHPRVMGYRLRGLLGRHLRRDMPAIHRRLIASGRAVRLGDAWAGPPAAPTSPDLARAVARVRALFGQS